MHDDRPVALRRPIESQSLKLDRQTAFDDNTVEKAVPCGSRIVGVAMTADDFYRAMRERVNRSPFQPFAVELLDGSQIEFDRPKSLAFRGGAAAGFDRSERLVCLKSYEVKQVIDVPASALQEG